MNTPPTYQLTEQERAGMYALANRVSASQLAVYQQSIALEALERDVDAAQTKFSGALSFLLSVHGYASGSLSTDFSTITPNKDQL